MIRSGPKNGDKRTRKFFAWLPTRLWDGTKIWLEWLEIEETYFDSFGSDCGADWIGHWPSLRLVKKNF